MKALLVNSWKKRQARHDIRFGAREDGEPLADGLARFVHGGELAKHVGVPCFGLGELLIQASEIRVAEILREEGETLPGSGLDEPEKEESIGEPAPVGSREPEEALGVRVSLVSAETPSAGEEPLVDEPEMLELFDGERAHAADQLVMVRVGNNERKRRGRRFLLAMGVIVEERVEVRRRDLDPRGRRSGEEHGSL